MKYTFNTAAQSPSLFEAANEFRRVFNLSATRNTQFYLHDSLHAITGLGITTADELRVTIYERVLLYEERRNLRQIIEGRLSDLYESLGNHNRAPGLHKLNVKPNGLESTAFRQLQIKAMMLSAGEVEAHIERAHDLHTTIRKITGKKYYDLTAKDIRKLDFRQVDISVDVSRIKAKLDRKTNRDIEIASARILAKAAKAQGRPHDIPAAGTPWHGPARRSFKR